jgi:hypothetical protein
MNIKRILPFLLVLAVLMGCTSSAERTISNQTDESSVPAQTADAESTAEPDLTDVLWEESSAFTQSDDMSVQYPNAYRVFSEIYGAYFYVDHGAFLLQWEGAAAAIKLEPIEIEDIYEGTDLTTEVETIGMNALGLYGLSYSVVNHTEEEISIYNEIPQQQIFLDGTWWNVETNYWARNLSMYTSFEPGKNEFSENLKVIYSSDGLHPISEYPGAQLPAGQYRLVIPLSPFDESNLIFEFEIR